MIYFYPRQWRHQMSKKYIRLFLLLFYSSINFALQHEILMDNNFTDLKNSFYCKNINSNRFNIYLNTKPDVRIYIRKEPFISLSNQNSFLLETQGFNCSLQFPDIPWLRKSIKNYIKNNYNIHEKYYNIFFSNTWHLSTNDKKTFYSFVKYWLKNDLICIDAIKELITLGILPKGFLIDAQVIEEKLNESIDSLVDYMNNEGFVILNILTKDEKEELLIAILEALCQSFITDLKYDNFIKDLLNKISINNPEYPKILSDIINNYYLGALGNIDLALDLLWEQYEKAGCKAQDLVGPIIDDLMAIIIKNKPGFSTLKPKEALIIVLEHLNKLQNTKCDLVVEEFDLSLLKKAVNKIREEIDKIYRK